MDVQVKAGSLVRTIVASEISSITGKILSRLQAKVAAWIEGFLAAGVSAVGMLALENCLAECVREAAREILQWLVSNLEPEVEHPSSGQISRSMIPTIQEMEGHLQVAWLRLCHTPILEVGEIPWPTYQFLKKSSFQFVSTRCLVASGAVSMRHRSNTSSSSSVAAGCWR